jgi:hypothetical protein
MKAAAIIHHYGTGNCDFTIRATGKLEWRSPGDPPTEEQIEQWIEDYTAFQELQNQVAQCQRLLDETDKTMCSDWDYPDDVAEWVAYRKVLREILKSDELCDMPKKPF